MSKAWLDLWVGLFVVAGIGALLFLALKVGNMSSVRMADSYQVSAHFDNIGGLKVRAPVKSAGVVVGRVTGISFDDKTYEAEVVLSLDQRYAFPKVHFGLDPDLRPAGRAIYRLGSRRR